MTNSLVQAMQAQVQLLNVFQPDLYMYQFKVVGSNPPVNCFTFVKGQKHYMCRMEMMQDGTWLAGLKFSNGLMEVPGRPDLGSMGPGSVIFNMDLADPTEYLDSLRTLSALLKARCTVENKLIKITLEQYSAMMRAYKDSQESYRKGKGKKGKA